MLYYCRRFLETIFYYRSVRSYNAPLDDATRDKMAKKVSLRNLSRKLNGFNVFIHSGGLIGMKEMKKLIVIWKMLKQSLWTVSSMLCVVSLPRSKS